MSWNTFSKELGYISNETCLVHSKLKKFGVNKGKKRGQQQLEIKPKQVITIQFLSRLVMDTPSLGWWMNQSMVLEVCMDYWPCQCQISSWVIQWAKLVSEKRQGPALLSYRLSKESFSDLLAGSFSVAWMLNIVMVQGWLKSLLSLFTYSLSRINLINSITLNITDTLMTSN